MKTPIPFVSSCICMLAIACNQPKQPSAVLQPITDTSSQLQPIDVSIIGLIASPNQFNGKKVRVAGYMHVEFEGNALYLHKEDYTRSLFGNSVWIQMPKDNANLYKAITSCKDRYVVIEGTFNDMAKIYKGGRAGALNNVISCDVITK